MRYTVKLGSTGACRISAINNCGRTWMILHIITKIISVCCWFFLCQTKTIMTHLPIFCWCFVETFPGPMVMCWPVAPLLLIFSGLLQHFLAPNMNIMFTLRPFSKVVFFAYCLPFFLCVSAPFWRGPNIPHKTPALIHPSKETWAVHWRSAIAKRHLWWPLASGPVGKSFTKPTHPGGEEKGDPRKEKYHDFSTKMPAIF